MYFLGGEWTAADDIKQKIGGETGIRTLGTIASTTVFETAPFDHSGISPSILCFIVNNL